jgi:hypothetical protein
MRGAAERATCLLPPEPRPSGVVALGPHPAIQAIEHSGHDRGLKAQPRKAERSPQVEMSLDKLDVNTLPTGERRFLEIVACGCYPAYGGGFEAEFATLRHLALHFMHLNEFANVALLRVGSGGRFEGAGLGDSEFVLLTKDSMGEGWQPPPESGFGTRLYPSAYFETLKETAGSDILGVGLTPYMRVTLEHKRLDGPDQLSYYPGNDTPYPGRILEGEYVAGNEALVTEARRRVFNEIMNDPKIIRGLKKDLKVYRKVCQTGLSRNVPQFDRDKNEIYFNPRAQQYGLKYGLLRYVQTALSIELFELFQRKQFPVEEFLDLSQSVEERIRYAFRKGWVAKDEDLTIAGVMYIQGADFNNTAKIHHYTDESTTFRLKEGSLAEIHNDIVALFENRLLVD